MSQVQEIPTETNAVPFRNKTAEFISRSCNFEHSQLNDQLVSTAIAIDKAKTPQERKYIIDHQLNVTIGAYSDLMSTLSRYACFVCLSYKVEKLWKIDIAGMNYPFRNDEEAFDWWLNEFLRENGAKPSLRSKVKHYVKENNDLDMINHLTFNKAWIVSKFQRILRGYGSELDGEFYDWAARKDTETIDITTELVNKVTEQDWEVTLKSRIEKLGEEPSEKQMAKWAIEHTELMEKRFARHTLRKPEALGTKSLNKIKSELKGVDTDATSASSGVFIRAVHDKLNEDVSKEIYSFLHSGFYDTCVISGVKFDDFWNKLEVHHVASRSEAVRKRLFNLIPICQEVHSEINNKGIKFVLEKYSISEEEILACAISVSVQYLFWLEKNA